MSDMYNLRIIAADRVFYEGPCLSLIVPAFDGEKEVLAHHEAMVIAVTDGEMRYKLKTVPGISVMLAAVSSRLPTTVSFY